MPSSLTVGSQRAVQLEGSVPSQPLFPRALSTQRSLGGASEGSRGLSCRVTLGRRRRSRGEGVRGLFNHILSLASQQQMAFASYVLG